MADRISLDLIGSTPEPIDVPCGHCGERHVYRIDILRLTETGVQKIGSKTFGMCETRPA